MISYIIIYLYKFYYQLIIHFLFIFLLKMYKVSNTQKILIIQIASDIKNKLK